MPSCDVQRFVEPSAFAAAIRGATVDLTVLDPGPFAATATCIDLGSLRIQRFTESLPRVMHVASAGERAAFSFHTRAGPGIVRGGIDVPATSLARVSRQPSYFQRSLGPVSWGSVSLSVSDIVSLQTAASTHDLAPPLHEQIISPPPDTLTCLRRVHAAAGRLAEQAPEVIQNPEAARGLRQVLLQALVACIARGDVHQATPAQRRHDAIMRRFQGVMEADPGRPIYVLELAAAVGASLRALSACCQQHLGMGPKRYLLLRRMHLAKAALLAADPAVTTVTDVATQHGFWQFGRFAGEYKSLFGELPSATLHKPSI